jgi:capsular exopolysaccharide synthesis family protein
MPSSSRDLWVLKERDGSFASNVRILATRISKIKETYGYKSYLFSSPGGKEGKTVTATNLALAMSEDSDCKIALIDANFRAPRIASLFNLDNSRGLLSAVSGQIGVSECIARVTGRNLIVMTSGGTHPNPGQVISDPKFKSLLADLSKSVDYLFVDTPAALPHADVPLLAQNVDAVIMVASKENTKAGLYNKAIETIGKTRIVGSIFVDAPGKRMREE